MGGTIIEAWSPPEALASCGVTDTGLDDGFNHNEYSNTIDNRYCKIVYSVSGLSCPGAEAYLTVIFHSFLHNNNINSDYILGENIYFTPHTNFS